ncbi:MAG: S8 family serine peptidase, partial [Clostridia bacterium]
MRKPRKMKRKVMDMKRSRRFLCKAIAFIFLMSNLLVSLPDIQIVFAADKGVAEDTIKHEDREKTEIIVKYKSGADEENVKKRIKQSLKLAKFEDKKKHKKFNLNVLEVGKADDISKVIDMLKSDPDIEYVQPNYKLGLQALPADTRFNEQWGLLNNGQEVEGYTGRTGVDINAVNAWNITKGSPAVVVGVLDTGIDINHNDLKNSIFVNTGEIAGNNIDDDINGYIDDVNGWDFVNADNTVYDSASLDLHGTHVAGIIAASANNEGISGVAPDIKLLPLKFINGNWGYTTDAIDAIEYAMNMSVKIMNSSFGGTDNNFALKDTMVNSGILYVSSAGNRGADVAVLPVYPASFDIPNVLSVASIDSMGVISPYSSYGNKIHVAAPGINILSTTPDNTYDYYSGTSASAPFVTGAVALLKSYVPSYNYAQLAQRIKDNVVTSASLQGKVTSGGRADAYAVLTNIKPQADTYTGPGNDTGTVPVGQQGGNEDTWYTQDQLAKIKEKLHYGEGGVNPASGNYSISSTDLSVPAPGFQINISRTYNSRDPKSTPMGQGWTFGFEGKVEGTDVVEVTLPSGGAQRFRLDQGIYKPEDSRSTFVKNADNTYTLTTKDQYNYYFNSSRYLYKMEDRNGNAVNVQVAADGKVQKITDAVGKEFVVNYNAKGLIDNITGPESTVISYGYDANNRLITVTDAEGSIMRYLYDTWGFITEMQDHYQKRITKITYNHSEGENQHKVSQAIDSLGNTINYSYDMINKKTTASDLNNRATTYWFDSAMYTIREQDPEGKSTYTEYFLEGGKNKYGDIKSIIDRNGNKTEYAIDDRGNVTKIINPDLSFKEFSYDEKNNLIWDKDESVIFSFYIYDSDKKLLIKKAQPLNGIDQYVEGVDVSKFAITTYSYYTDAEAQSLFLSSAKALLKSVTDPEGNITTYTYDADGNIKTVKDAELKETVNTYNRLGLKTNVLSPGKFNTGYVYDKNGLIEKISLAQGETTRIVYDMTGRKIQEIQPEQYNPAMDDLSNHRYNDSTVGYRYAYYDNGLLLSVTDPENNTTSYTYDVYGNKLTETRPDNSVMRYEYDVMDRLKKVYFKDNAAAPESILYDYSYVVLDDGRTQKTETRYLNDTENAITVEIYDYTGRLTEEQYPDGSKEKTVYNLNGTVGSRSAKNGSITYFKYDGLNRLSEQWTLIEVSDGIMLYSYSKLEYDKAGRKTAEKIGKEKVALYEVPMSFAIKNYSYYRNGNVKVVTDAEGRKTEYYYDDDGNLSREDVYAGINSMLITEYTYNHLGKPTEKKVHVAEGDIYGNIFGSVNDKVLLTAYTYDKNGNLKTQTTPDTVTTTYTYDNLDRQLSISQPGADEEGVPTTITNSFTYNWEGKLLTKTDARSKTTRYEYNLKGYLIKVTDANNGVTAYEYDRAGRKTIEVSPNNYNIAKSLKEMNRVEYVYDSMDRVKAKLDVYADPQTAQWITLYTKSFVYDISGNVTKELDALGYEDGEGVALDERLNTGYGIEYTYDLAGNIRTMLDPVSKQRGLAFTSRYEYDALGRKVSVTNAKG